MRFFNDLGKVTADRFFLSSSNFARFNQNRRRRSPNQPDKAFQKRKSSKTTIFAPISESARAAYGKYITESGKSDSEISAARKRALDSAENLRTSRENLKIEYNEEMRVPEVISPDCSVKTGFLTAPSGRKRTEILKNFLRQNAELFGISAAQAAELKTTADYTNPNGVLSFVQFEQRITDIPVFRGEVKAGFTRQGEIVRIINNLAPNLDYENLSADFGDSGVAAILMRQRTLIWRLMNRILK